MSEIKTYTRELSTKQAAALQKHLDASSFELSEKPYAICSGKATDGRKLNVTIYEKGPKVLVQGKDCADFVRFILEPEILSTAELDYAEVNHPEQFSPHMGIDESGKGDFFGPLVIAGVYVNKEVVHQLIGAGVTDSKKIGSDNKIRKLADEIRATKKLGLRFEVIRINPSRYNELYEQFKNLNKLLAWGHARVIENILEQVPDCPRALSDQFANKRVLESSLLEQGQQIKLVQKTKAESDPAVAAASILARESFINWLRDASEELGCELGKGVSAKVKKAATQIKKREGSEALSRIAKMHFKTAQEV